MSHITLDEITDQTDIMDSTHFRLLFGNVPGSGDSRPLTILCQTASIAGITIEPMEVGLHAHTVRFRGKQTVNPTLAVGFVESSGYEVQRRLRRWKEFTVGTNTGTSSGFKNQYAISPQLEIMDVTGNVVDIIKYHNLWITELPEVQLDGQSSTPMLLQTTFTFDYLTSIHHDYL